MLFAVLSTVLLALLLALLLAGLLALIVYFICSRPCAPVSPRIDWLVILIPAHSGIHDC